MSDDTICVTPLEAATTLLAERVLASEPFIRYGTAQEHFYASPRARDLLQQLIDLQNALRRAPGGATDADLASLRRLREDVQANPIASAYIETQDAAVAFVREVNIAISGELGLDFASFAQRSGGCCC